MALATAYHPRSSSCLYVCHHDRLLARACVLAWETWRTGVLDTPLGTQIPSISSLQRATSLGRSLVRSLPPLHIADPTNVRLFLMETAKCGAGMHASGMLMKVSFFATFAITLSLSLMISPVY